MQGQGPLWKHGVPGKGNSANMAVNFACFKLPVYAFPIAPKSIFLTVQFRSSVDSSKTKEIKTKNIWRETLQLDYFLEQLHTVVNLYKVYMQTLHSCTGYATVSSTFHMPTLNLALQFGLIKNPILNILVCILVVAGPWVRSWHKWTVLNGWYLSAMSVTQSSKVREEIVCCNLGKPQHSGHSVRVI